MSSLTEIELIKHEPFNAFSKPAMERETASETEEEEDLERIGEREKGKKEVRARDTTEKRRERESAKLYNECFVAKGKSEIM